MLNRLLTLRQAASALPRQGVVGRGLLSRGAPRGYRATGAFWADKEEGESGDSADTQGDEDISDGEEDAGTSQLEARVEELESELKESQSKYVGILAEMENVRRIAKNDVEKANTYAIQKFAKSLLGVSDNLARAVESVGSDILEGGENPELAALHEGVTLTENELLKVFKQNGIEKFGSVGDDFDPNKHDAMFEYVDENLDSGKVGQLIQVGYSFKDRILRPAQVGTTKSN